jgi:hypothetical protein
MLDSYLVMVISTQTGDNGRGQDSWRYLQLPHSFDEQGSYNECDCKEKVLLRRVHMLHAARIAVVHPDTTVHRSMAEIS